MVGEQTGVSVAVSVYVAEIEAVGDTVMVGVHVWVAVTVGVSVPVIVMVLVGVVVNVNVPVPVSVAVNVLVEENDGVAVLAGVFVRVEVDEGSKVAVFVLLCTGVGTVGVVSGPAGFFLPQDTTAKMHKIKTAANTVFFMKTPYYSLRINTTTAASRGQSKVGTSCARPCAISGRRPAIIPVFLSEAHFFCFTYFRPESISPCNLAPSAA